MNKIMTASEMGKKGGIISSSRMTAAQRTARAKKAGKAGGWPKGKKRVPKSVKRYSPTEDGDRFDPSKCSAEVNNYRFGIIEPRQCSHLKKKGSDYCPLHQK